MTTFTTDDKVLLRQKMGGQLRAIVRLRWLLFVHSLRTSRGQMEVVSRFIIGIVLALGALGGALGLGGAAWLFVSQGKIEWLTLLLWPVFLFWQLFPIVATAFTENLDSSALLRFPLSYHAYFLVRLVYGSADPATTMSSFWLMGIWVGAGYAKPRLLIPAAVIFLIFGAVNVGLSRMIFSWLERWLAQRRTREILGVLFFLVFLSIQLLGPLTHGRHGMKKPQAERIVARVTPLQRALPPGLAAASLARFEAADYSGMFEYSGLLCIYGFAFLALLSLRLKEEYRGENLSETSSRADSKGQIHLHRKGWALSGLPPPVAAVFEKELHYLMRSGPMLFTLIVPVFMLFVFRNAASSGGFLANAPELAFPLIAGYSLLLVTNLVYNSFGGDGAGIQLFFAAPVKFGQILIGKNLAHATVVMFEMMLALVGVCFMYGIPRIDALVATAAGLLFAIPLNFAAGDWLSILFPKKIDYATFGRQRASQTTILASFGVQIVVLGTSALTMIISLRRGSLWPAAAIFCALAVFSIMIYRIVLMRIDNIAQSRREALISELSRA